MITSDIVLGYGIFTLVGYAIGHAAGESNGFINMFDFSKETKIMITKFWRELGNSLFGKDDKSTSTDTYTQRTPEVIKKDSLSAK